MERIGNILKQRRRIEPTAEQPLPACPGCFGTGDVTRFDDPMDDTSSYDVTCDECGGTGVVACGCGEPATCWVDTVFGRDLCCDACEAQETTSGLWIEQQVRWLRLKAEKADILETLLKEMRPENERLTRDALWLHRQVAGLHGRTQTLEAENAQLKAVVGELVAALQEHEAVA